MILRIPMALWWQIVYIMVGFDLLIFLFIIYWEWWRKKGRIQVRVKTPLKEYQTWKKPEKDGKTIVMQKERKRKKIPEWKFTFSRQSLLDVPKWPRFTGRMGKAIDVMYQAVQAINYDFKLKVADQPKWDKKTSKEYIEAEILKARGQDLKMQLPTLFWLILIVLVIDVVFGFILVQRVLIG